LRAIRLVFVKLWIDTQSPRELRGSLQPIPEGKQLSFADQEGLISALNDFVQAETQSIDAAEVFEVEPNSNRDHSDRPITHHPKPIRGKEV
jgi:hypothetical protein